MARCWLTTSLMRSISRMNASRAVITVRCSSLKRDAGIASRLAEISVCGALGTGAGCGSSWLTRRANRAAWVSAGRTAKLYSTALLPRRRWPSQPSRSAITLTLRSVVGSPGSPASS
ncbi:hypothetical protein D9M69_517400 [compost metagenome]